MPEEQRDVFRYRVLRYSPNAIRDEWVNIGVLLEHAADGRLGMRLIEEPSEIARVRRLHPQADESFLRALPTEFESRLGGPAAEASAHLAKLDDTLSNALQFSPSHGTYAEDFDAELDRLYRDHVAPPPRARGGIAESTRAWIKARINDVFLRRRVPRLERSIRVDEFTQPGDPLRLDYGYRNGVRGYLHAVALGRDPSQAKVLAYTAGRIRARLPQCEFTAITESGSVPGNPRHQFIEGLFKEQGIAMVPLNHIERFAEDLRRRLS